MSELKRQLMAKSGGYKRRAPRIAPGKTGEEIEEMPSLGQVAGLVFIAIVMAIGIVAGNSGRTNKEDGAAGEEYLDRRDSELRESVTRLQEHADRVGGNTSFSVNSNAVVTVRCSLPMTQDEAKDLAQAVWDKCRHRTSVDVVNYAGRIVASRSAWGFSDE